ncbi:hexosyltransferase [Nephila pilipes]|uniref:Hexosyltransferase n=1 Tax=Nephila pilipes TaxID=299642 RepID=A0A8X6TYA7_NEPPI|nr:hexosyltransferase [Nephila pilipes]
MLVVFVVVTYALSSCLYMFLDREPPSLLLLSNATWWRTNSQPFNMSLLEGANDMNWLVDTSGFEFLINNKRCDDDESVFLVVFVHSAPTNFHKRQVISLKDPTSLKCEKYTAKEFEIPRGKN